MTGCTPDPTDNPEAEAEKVWERELELAKVAARREAFEQSPLWFTVWDISQKAVHAVFWLLFWSLVTQCTCGGCIW